MICLFVPMLIIIFYLIYVINIVVMVRLDLFWILNASTLQGDFRELTLRYVAIFHMDKDIAKTTRSGVLEF